VTKQDVPVSGTFVGRTVANRTINVVARVTGVLLERPYVEGDPISEGAVLFRIDPQELQATLESARAKVAQCEAQVSKADTDLKRVEPLAKAGAAPIADLDTARTTLLGAQADLRAAKSQVVNAELNLSYTTIKAPFSGLAGKANVDVGGLISPSSGTLCVLDQVDPIAVEFTVSEQELLAWRADIAGGRIKTPGLDHLTVVATLLNGASYPETGKLSFQDVRIRAETGTALIRAVFPNAKGTLRAGQFVRVTLTGATRVGAILVPQSAVIQSPAGSSLYVVKADQTIEARSVTVGQWDGQQWLVNSGITPGEVVVIDGVQKARPGAKVEVTTADPAAAAPAASAAPAPTTKP
jgi:membrane fusion protein (multidrug efflux system)